MVLDPVASRLPSVLGLVLLLAAHGPTAAQGAGATDRPLGLRDAVVQALDENLELDIERVEPVLAGFRVDEAKAEFDPSFDWSAEYLEGERFVNSILEQFAPDGLIHDEVFTPRWDYGGRASSGTEYGVSLVTPVHDTDNPLRLFDRSYTPQLSLNLRQPLLRNRSREVNRVRIRQAENAKQQSTVEVRLHVLALVQEVERAYWTAVQAQGRLQIARDSLGLAEALIQRLESMVERGMAKEFDLLRPRLEAERRRADVARAEADLDIAETRLRSLIGPSLDASTRIVPTDVVAPEEPPADHGAVLEAALVRRPEIEQQQLTIRHLELDRDYADDQTRWRLDAMGRASYAGLAGEDLNPAVITPPVAADRTSYFDAFQDGATSWAVGFEMAIPLGRRELLARAGPARVRLQQETTRLQVLKNRIATDVETAHRDLTAEWSRLQIHRRATALAREQLATQQRNMEAGLATILQVIEAQEYLTDALDAENTSLWRYAVARSRLHAAAASAPATYGIALE